MRSIKTTRRMTVTAALLVLACCGGSGTSSYPTPSTCGDWPSQVIPAGLVANSAIASILALDECTVVAVGYDRSDQTGYGDGNSRAFVQKIALDAAGTPSVRWDYLLDTGGTDEFRLVRQVDGKIRVVGNSDGTVASSTNAGKAGVVMAELSPDGNVLSLSQFGTVKPNLPVADLTLANGSEVLVGYDDPYVLGSAVIDFEDPWLAGIGASASGFTLNWIENAGTPESDFYTAAVSQGDAVILARTVTGGTGQGIHLTKRQGTESADPSWETRLTPSPFDVIAGLHLLADDTLLVFGTTYNLLGDTALGSGDFFLARIDSGTGQVYAVDQFGSANNDWAKRLVVTEEALYALGEEEVGQGIWRGRVVKLSPEGVPLETKDVAPGANTYLTDAAPVKGGLLVSGFYRSLAADYQGFLQFIPGF